jgi:metal-dependent amidase/aminoacylase/carboxypeptidase family protein
LISVCSFQSGNAFNIIPECAKLLGTIRTYDPTVQDMVHRRMQEIVHYTAMANGATAEIEIDKIVPVAYNDPKIADLTRRLATNIAGIRHVEADYRVSPSDDVAEFLRAAPGCQVILGAALEGGFPHHNPRFDIDESAMPLGVALLCSVTTHLLS